MVPLGTVPRPLHPPRSGRCCSTCRTAEPVEAQIERFNELHAEYREEYRRYYLRYADEETPQMRGRTPPSSWFPAWECSASGRILPAPG